MADGALSAAARGGWGCTILRMAETGRRRGDARASRLLNETYRRLLSHYGPQGWWPSDGPFEMIVGAILTQNTAWTNAARAIAALKDAGLMSPAALREAPQSEVAEAVRPSGYFNEKARKLKAMAGFLGRYGDDVEAWRAMAPRELRAELLGVYGIGPETADDIVLYAAGLPSFVIDVYTERIVRRMSPRRRLHGYAALQEYFERNLPRDASLYNEYHALLDAHAKEVCLKRDPRCGACTLRDLCATGRKALV